MKRLIAVAIIIMVSALFTSASPAHASVPGACKWQWDGITADALLTAGPLYGEQPATPWTSVTCQFVVNGVPGHRITQANPGPVGTLTFQMLVGALRPGDEVWLCTSVYTTLTETLIDHGCNYAFTY